MSGPAWLRQGSSYYYFSFPSEIKIGLGARISAPGGCLAKQFSELMPNLRRVHAEKVLTGQQGCGLPFLNRPAWKAGVRGPGAPALIYLQCALGCTFFGDVDFPRNFPGRHLPTPLFRSSSLVTLLPCEGETFSTLMTEASVLVHTTYTV